MKEQIDKLTKDIIISGLRNLRLWHWKSVEHNRKVQNFYKLKDRESVIEFYEKQANFHLKQVQLLNYFFETEKGDTAEKDLEIKQIESTKQD